MTGRTWELPLAFTVPFLNLNQTLHKQVKSARIKAIRECAQEAATYARVPHLERFTAELHYIPPTRQRRDPENWVPTSKAAVDGLVLAGVADDDSPAYFYPSLPVMDPVQKTVGCRFYVVVRELVPGMALHDCPDCTHRGDTP